MSADLLNSREMSGMPALMQAKKAIMHTLQQAHDRPHWGYYLGFGTQSFALLTEALATITADDLAEVRESWTCPNPKNPAEDPDAIEMAVRVAGEEWEPSTGEIIDAIDGLSVPSRMELFEALRERFCFRCGGVTPVKPCGCGLPAPLSQSRVRRLFIQPAAASS